MTMKFSTPVRPSHMRSVFAQSATIRSWVSGTCGAVYFVADGEAEKIPGILSDPGWRVRAVGAERVWGLGHVRRRVLRRGRVGGEDPGDLVEPVVLQVPLEARHAAVHAGVERQVEEEGVEAGEAQRRQLLDVAIHVGAVERRGVGPPGGLAHPG